MQIEKRTERRSCENCYYEAFDEKAYPCSRCVNNVPEENMFRPKIGVEQTKRKRGEWIKNSDGNWECSECHIAIRGSEKPLYSYCAWCGVYMKEEESDGSLL